MLNGSAACERNKGPILEVLREALALRSAVLEIGSGTGQHAVYFAAHLPHLSWQPTERTSHLPALEARIRREGGPNVHPPRALDVSDPDWQVAGIDAVFTANTLHIMSWPQVQALFHGVAQRLARDGTLCIYGPFRYDGAYTSASNAAFDRMLKDRDPASGLREVSAVAALAEAGGLKLRADHDLPAFNRLLVFHRAGDSKRADSS